MARKFFITASMILVVISLGCGGKRVKAGPTDPMEQYKEEVLLRDYGFFVTSEERKQLRTIKTIAEVDIFVHRFWWGDKALKLPSRDPDPNTPEHELKNTIDSRIQDIKNEIFSGDSDIPLTRFDRNGGVKGDLAHVYLLYGMPHFKAQLPRGANHVELMVWYYFDLRGKPLFKFLFYDNYGTVRLFRHYTMGQESLFDPLASPLKEISNRFVINQEQLYELWLELEQKDPERAFIGALLQFSYYSDIVLEGGGSKKFGALDPPKPAALVVAKFKPSVLGQPDDLTVREFISSRYNSLVPINLVISKSDRPAFYLQFGYADIDWEVKGEQAEFVLDLRISFQNKKTKGIREFLVRLSKVKPRSEVDQKRGGPVTMGVSLDSILNFAQAGESQQTLRQLIDNLDPGTYVVNVDLRHAVTKKSAGGWREEITIK